MKCEKIIKIKKKVIVGIKSPKLIIKGNLYDSTYNLVLIINGKKQNYEMTSLNDRGGFILSCLLKKSDKKIEVLLTKKAKKEKLFVIHNNIFVRGFYKIEPFVDKIAKVLSSIKKSIKFLWREHHFLIPPILWKKYLDRVIVKFRKLLHLEYNHPFKQKDYIKWIKNCEEKPVYKDLEYNPLISILIPVYNINRKYLSECLDSILNQHYQNFEVCLADDCSTLQETIDTLKEYENLDKRIKVVYRKENGHISKATNSALKIAKGEFIALMDNDDIITENALYEMVYALNQNKKLDLIYSDEDKLDMKGKRCEPHFKPDYSPDSLLGGNYICHFEILRKSIVDEIGGEKSEYVGAQDFDFFLRFVEKTTPERIYHIPKILYHWRKVPGSTADTIESKDYAIDNGKKAVEAALERRGLNALVYTPIKTTHYIVEYKYKKEPKVSIIIPTKDMSDTLENCISSIYKKTNYKNYEVIIINNNSKEEKTYKLFNKLKRKYDNISIYDYNHEFNYSKINNFAAKKAKGSYYLFLNNDTEVISPNWIKVMVGYAMQDHIGCVGVKLLYEDDTIQHGGVVLGIDGTARHSFMYADADSTGFYGRLLVPYNYSAVTAACMMISKKKFNQVNGFDENLAVAFNDIDLNLKVLKTGYYNIFLPQVELYHYESKTRGLDTTTEKYKKFLYEKDYLQKRWKDELNNDKFYNKNFSKMYDFMLNKHNDSSNKKKRFNFLPKNIILCLMLLYCVFNAFFMVYNNSTTLYETKNPVLNVGEIYDKSFKQEIKVNNLNYIDKIGIMYGTYKRKNNSTYKFTLYKDNNILYSEKFNAKDIKDVKYKYYNIGKIKIDQNSNYYFQIDPIKVDKFNAITILKSKSELAYSISIKSIFYNQVLIFAIVLFVLTLIIIYMINKNIFNINNNFIRVIFCIMLCAFFIYPTFETPDEPFHFFSSYRISQYNISKSAYKNMRVNKITVPKNYKCLYYSNVETDMGVTNKNKLKSCFLSEKNIKQKVIKGNAARFFVYFPSALGIKIADMISNSPIFIYNIGRLFNFLISFLIILYAIKIIPKYKKLLFLIIGIPMFIQQIISYSYDSILNSLCILIFALLIKFIHDKQINKKEAIIYIASSIIIYSIKSPYIILSLPFLFLGKKYYNNSQKNRIISLFCYILSLLVVGLYIKYLNGLSIPEITNEVEKNSITNLFNIKYSLKVIYYTLKQQGLTYLKQLIGNFGWLKYELNSLIIILYYIMIIVVSLSEENKMKIKERLYYLLGIAILISGIFVSMFLMCTGVGEYVIQGVQGRYFIPIVPFILLLIIPKTPITKIKNETVYTFIIISTFIYFITILTSFY